MQGRTSKKKMSNISSIESELQIEQMPSLSDQLKIRLSKGKVLDRNLNLMQAPSKSAVSSRYFSKQGLSLIIE